MSRKAKSAYVAIPPGARPPTNPFSPTTALDHSVWEELPPSLQQRVPNSLAPPQQQSQLGRSRSAKAHSQNNLHDTLSFSEPLEDPYAYQQHQHQHQHQHPSRQGSTSSPTTPKQGSATSASSDFWNFPEPQLYYNRTHSEQSPTTYAHEESTGGPHAYTHARDGFRMSLDSLGDVSQYQTGASNLFSDEVNQQIQIEDGVRKFQAGDLTRDQAEWYHLVSPEFRSSLPEKEVLRQSRLFEYIRSELEYVKDLETIRDVFVDTLRESSPPILKPPDVLNAFIEEVFFNILAILAVHHRLLGALFQRQRDQHPIIHSINDIVLEMCLDEGFRNEYEKYVKHYNFAESRHRRELKSNQPYADFISKIQQSSSGDGGDAIRKRDFITFLSRPVTRLTRTHLALKDILKATLGEEEDSSEDGGLPLVISILSDFIKSTQPGWESSEAKVRFYGLCESLEFQMGEIIDMDLYNEQRTLVHSGPLARKNRTNDASDWHVWNDVELQLLDNYVIMTKPRTTLGGAVKQVVISRPIPLEFLKLGAFIAPPESRRDESNILTSLNLMKSTQWYPFTIYHTFSATRRYTLYTQSEEARKKWKEKFEDAVGVRKVWAEANQLFATTTISDRIFSVRTDPSKSKTDFTGPILAAAPFLVGKRAFIAIGTANGLYVGLRNDPTTYRAVISSLPVSSMASLPAFNQLIVSTSSGQLFSYSLDIIARMSQGELRVKNMNDNVETLCGSDVGFFGVGNLAGRTLVVYGQKGFTRQVTLQALEAVVQQAPPSKSKSQNGGLKNYRPFGTSFYVPGSANYVVMLQKTLAIASERGMVIVDPTNLGNVITIPDFSKAPGNPAMSMLKVKCDSSKTLGIVQSGVKELLIIYEKFGCYVTSHGEPTRKSGFLRWDTDILSYAFRAPHLLLFSKDAVEVREVSRGRLEQVIEGSDIRMVQTGPPYLGPFLVAMSGKLKEGGKWDRLTEVIETAPIAMREESVANNTLWDEW